MIRVLIPKDDGFWEYKDECKSLYEKVQGWICDTNSFEFIVNNTFFYLFLNDKKLIGAIYYFVDENNKLYLNGFTKKKMIKTKQKKMLKRQRKVCKNMN